MSHDCYGIAVPCDKSRIVPFLVALFNAKQSQLRTAGQIHQERQLICMRHWLMRGLPGWVSLLKSRLSKELMVVGHGLHARVGSLQQMMSGLRWSHEDDSVSKANGRTLVHYATVSNDIHVMLELVRIGSSGLNMPLKEPDTENGEIASPPLSLAMMWGNRAFLELLLDARAEPHATSLNFACWYGRLDNCTFWLARFPDSDVNQVNRFGKSALTTTLMHCHAGSGMVQIVHRLLEARANVRVRDQFGAGVFHNCIHNENVVPIDVYNLLLRYAADVSDQIRTGNPQMRSLYDKAHKVAKSDVEMASLHRWCMVADDISTLGAAACFSKVDALAWLLQARADPALKNNSGEDPLPSAQRWFGGVAPPMIEALLIDRVCDV